MIREGDLVTLDNGGSYIVAKKTNLEGTDYVFLITEDGVSDAKLFSVNGTDLQLVTDALIIEKLFEVFSVI